MLGGCAPSRLSLRVLGVLAVVVMLVTVTGLNSGFAEGVLCLAPALLLGVVLVTRRYPGERLLARWAGHVPRPPRAAVRGGLPARRPGAGSVPRGGLLMGFALAVRPPPAVTPS